MEREIADRFPDSLKAGNWGAWAAMLSARWRGLTDQRGGRSLIDYTYAEFHFKAVAIADALLPRTKG